MWSEKGKKKFLYLLCILFFVSLLSISAFAQQQGIGSGAVFRTGVDARALGMGGAFVAVADSYSASYWNPAGLAQIERPRFGAMSMNKFGLGINFNFLSGAANLGKLPIQTPSFKFLPKVSFLGRLPIQTPSFKFLPKISVAGTLMESSMKVRATDPQGNPIGPINYSERLYMGSAALKFPGLGLVGGTIRNYSFIAPRAGVGGKDATAHGIGYDAGLLAQLFDNVWIGAAGFDITGTGIQWENTPTEPTDLAPARYVLGAAYRGQGLIVAGQYTLGTHETIPDVARLGAEYDLDMLALRAGAVRPSNWEGLKVAYTVGIGIQVNQLNIDMAWLQNKEIEAENAKDTIVLSAEFSF